MDIEIAVDALELSPFITNLVLFSGDGDFTPLVEAVQRKGVKVSVVSTITTQPPMVSDDLRRQADEFIDIARLIDKIGRDPAERQDRGDRLPRFIQEGGEERPDRPVRFQRFERVERTTPPRQSPPPAPPTGPTSDS